jgi:hypothetical protein
MMLALAVSIAGSGCEKESTWDEPGPAASFENFLMDWYRGEYETAFETITPEDRRVLTKPLDELEGKLDAQDMPAKADMLVVGRVDNPYDIKDIDLAEPLETKPDKGQKVTLELVYHDGREGEATMIWGGDRWYVDLPLEQKASEPAPKDAQEPEPEGQAADKPEQPSADEETDADGGSLHDQQQHDQQQDAGRQQGEQQ